MQMNDPGCIKRRITKDELLSYLPRYWKIAIPDITERSYWDLIVKAINETINAGGLVIPSLPTIFKAYETFNHDTFKLLLIGQDPYPTLGDANGYAFWSNAKIPAKSYMRMLEELSEEYGVNSVRIMKNGNLAHWRDQGVFMMNSALTIPMIPGRMNINHQSVWKAFTREIIEYLDKNFTFVTLAMGKISYEFADMVVINQGFVVKTGHPSPLNTRIPFIGTGCFRRCNDFLVKNEMLPIRWTI